MAGMSLQTSRGPNTPSDEPVDAQSVNGVNQAMRARVHGLSLAADVIAGR